jgi:hypothetical protein
MVVKRSSPPSSKQQDSFIAFLSPQPVLTGQHVDIIYTMSCFLYAHASRTKHLIPKRLLGELGQHKGSLVHLLAVVLEKLVLLLGGPAANGLLDIDAAVLGAHHETDLASGVGGDGGPAVLGDGEDFLALLLQVGDHAHVEPGVFGCESRFFVSESGSCAAAVEYARCTALPRP